ncbi:MAG: esterase-like activity of phytase family protein [Synechococcaceae cyanobacterium SM2_3_1]|nr:esterase-like activity of phytase family protein [Synechococcaceae cyanobacterium SM2_3_1]
MVVWPGVIMAIGMVLALGGPGPAWTQSNPPEVNLLGQAVFSKGALKVRNKEVGGLSGITYDPAQNLYYVISDDRAQRGPARFYTLQLDLNQYRFDNNAVTFTDVTFLTGPNQQPFPRMSLDPEGIAFARSGSLWISSEGEVNLEEKRIYPPFIREFSLQGRQLQDLPIPQLFLPQIKDGQQQAGIRNNLAFESLTLTPNQDYLFTATENALVQDGPASSVTQGSPVRILKYALSTGTVVGSYLYETDPVALAPQPASGFSTNGLVELLALDDQGTRLLALERSFSVGLAGTGNTIKLYEVDLTLASDLQGVESLNAVDQTEFTPAGKRLLLDFNDLGLTPGVDNLEGMTLGPKLLNGEHSLILVSDNNFSERQVTQILVLSLLL